MFKRLNRKNPQEQGSDSLETRTNKTPGIGRRGFVIGALATIAGCAAPNYIPMPSEDIPRHKKFMQHEYGKSADAVATEHLDVKATIRPYQGVPQELKKVVDESFEPSDVEARAFYELDKQNKHLSNIFQNAKMRRLVLHSVERNADVEGLQQYAQMSKDDLENVLTSLRDLDTSLRTLTFAQREALQKKLGDNEQFKAMAAYNAQSLSTLNQLAVAQSDIETIEGHLKEVYSANRLSANINRSTTGYDQYGDLKGEGRHVLEVLLDQNVKTLNPSPNSIFAQSYSKPDMKLRTAYNEIMQNIREEAAGWDDGSLHTITNEYLPKALNMVSQAHEEGLISDKQYQAMVRVVTKDAMDNIGQSAKEDGVSLFGDILVPAIPGYSVVAMFLNARDAFSDDHYSPQNSEARKAYAEMLSYGNAVKNGFQTRENYAGSTSPAVARFWSGAVSTALQVGAGVYLLGRAGKSDSSGGGSGPSVSPPVGGGETGGPGTTN